MLKVGIVGLLILSLAGTTLRLNKSSFELSKENASVTVSGTSTIHEWKMNMKAFNCKSSFIVDGSGLKGIGNVTFSCKATDLKSDNALMDKK